MRTRFLRGLALAAVLATAGLAVLGSAGAARAPQQKLLALAVLRDASSNLVGNVYFFEARGKVSVVATGARLAPGFHGFHIHAIGACEAASAFTSAGGHENPGAKTHGGHAGDMTPLLVNADGTAWASFRTDRFVDAEVFDADGSAVIVHAGADNLANIPTRYRTDAGAGPDAATLATGDAGARVACGLIRRAKS